jgi:hypothetical protein
VNAPGAIDVSPTSASSTRELARQLVARASRNGAAHESAALIAFSACELTYRALARSIGVAGANALLARARSQTLKTHPMLRDIRIDQSEGDGLTGMRAVIEEHGSADAAAGLEALLEVLLTLLGRFVGIDLVARLVAQGATIGTQEHEDTP